MRTNFAVTGLARPHTVRLLAQAIRLLAFFRILLNGGRHDGPQDSLVGNSGLSEKCEAKRLRFRGNRVADPTLFQVSAQAMNFSVS